MDINLETVYMLSSLRWKKKNQDPYTRLQTCKIKARKVYFSNIILKWQMMYSQLCHISITNDIQKAGSSADGIQYYLMLVKQNPHKHMAH